MSVGDVEGGWEHHVDLGHVLSSGPKRPDAGSLSRIEKYAQVLAPRQQSARVAAVARVIASARTASTHRASPTATSDGDDPQGRMMRYLCDVGDFVRRLRIQARFGELSRASLCLLRVQLCGEYAECDWIARPSDPWDADLPAPVGRRNASTQALHDAIRVRDILFRALPDLQKAELRCYRYAPEDVLELIVAGTVTREVRAPSSVRSLAMRAKLFGFRFWLEEGILENLQQEDAGSGAGSIRDGLIYEAGDTRSCA